MTHEFWNGSRTFWRKLLDTCLNFLFPPKGASHLLQTLTPEDIVKRARQSDSPAALFDYHDPLIHDLVWLAKYKADNRAVQLLGSLLYDSLFEEVSDLVAFRGGGKALLIPIPESRTRAKEKGFNQVVLIGEVMATIAHSPFELHTNLLIRLKEVSRQTDLKRRIDRLNNMKQVFSLTNPNVVRNRVVILIDDVTTTGATLKEAQKVIEMANPAAIRTLAFAH